MRSADSACIRPAIADGATRLYAPHHCGGYAAATHLAESVAGFNVRLSREKASQSAAAASVPPVTASDILC